MTALRLILGDQLSPEISSLSDCDKTQDLILMAEIRSETDYVNHHKKKIAFLFSAMRHFAADLMAQDYSVHYYKLEETRDFPDFLSLIRHILHRIDTDINQIIITHPGEYRLWAEIKSWSDLLHIPVEIRADDRFLCDLNDFNHWASSRKQLTMEFFYRQMRQKYQILMADGQPVGGVWNYDRDNRKPPLADLSPPAPTELPVDQITSDVLNLVDAEFQAHFGDLYPFHFAVTRDQARQVLRHFIQDRLCLFGDYQDAMVQGQPWMYHAHISFYLNCGLLLPMECLKAAEQAYDQGKAPLNAVEGFIRQILGWREYVRGIYWLKMPDYANQNFLQADRPLPDFYWNGNTQMNCLRQVILETKRNAYAHHIQRLMVLGNFALLAGIAPKQVNDWFLSVYADAYEWVELPNVTGMILFADGGFLGSKPYAAGGNYIHKMSDYCKSCTYRVSIKNGPKACPFNYLYWDFLARHQQRLSGNHRLAMIYRTYQRMSAEKKQAITDDSRHFLAALT